VPRHATIVEIVRNVENSGGIGEEQPMREPAVTIRALDET